MTLHFDSPERRYGPLSEMLCDASYLRDRPDGCEGDFFAARGPEGFCGRWGAPELAQFLADAGCMAHWRAQGYSRVWVEVDPNEIPGRYGMSVWTQVGECSELLMLAVVWLDYVQIDRLGHAYPSFGVEHLILQQPGRAFGDARPMPGQDAPSSGMLRRMFGLIRHWACMLGAGIISEIPQYFHTAYLFSEYFSFAAAEMEGFFKTACADLMPGHTLGEVSRAFAEHRVLYDGKPWFWPTELQVYGLSHDLQERIRAVRDARDPGHFSWA